LETSVEQLSAELELARAQGDALEETIQARLAEVRRRQEAAQRAELEVDHAQRLLEENREEWQRISERCSVVESEIRELVDQDARLTVELEEKLATLNTIEEERVELEALVVEREAERSSIEPELERFESDFSRLRVVSTQTEERLVAQRREQMRIQSELEERQDRRRRLEVEEEKDQERLLRLDENEQRDRQRSEELSAALEDLAGRVADAEQETSKAKESLFEAEKLLIQLRKENDSLRERREGQLLADNERRVRIDGIREKIAEELEVPVAELPVDEWRAVLLQEFGDKGLLKSLRSEQEQLSGRLRKNANVNLQAVDELTGEEGRRDQLGSQITDLEESKTTLLETVEALNDKSRDLFLETFEEVRQHFQELFATVFNGGTADLKLEEDVDPLEAGVEVFARPPGKRINSLRALSGGEKALTAVSVLFALFRTKPSPFCILDEVDAPLDESNIRRFVRVLQRFSEQSQFLIITHSRVTMGEAERLYGVTMEEEGVSRKVAVRVDKEENEEAIEDGTVSADSLLPPPRLGGREHFPEESQEADEPEAAGAALD